MNIYKKSFRITSPYGNRKNPITGNGIEFHKGIDIVGEDKTIYSPVDGVVTISANGTQCGNQIAIKDNSGFTYFFCHLASRNLTLNRLVKVGDIIGIEGKTGQVTGVHLHFEVWKGDRLTGELCNPSLFLGVENAVGYKPLANEIEDIDKLVKRVSEIITIGDMDGLRTEIANFPDGRLAWVCRKIVNKVF